MTYRDWLDQQETRLDATLGASHTPLLLGVMSNMGPVFKAWLVLMLVNLVVLSVIL